MWNCIEDRIDDGTKEIFFWIFLIFEFWKVFGFFSGAGFLEIFLKKLKSMAELSENLFLEKFLQIEQR